ncbi:Nif3-like dinuclear metal center hexameric protein [Rubrivirga sp. IMCC45206]|uniref:Nif3-like dinuclear metal center hexameric protein n=1 Tax=Rubrivirga sp. IMCC45206 TaxID=3391614 RepID=UPI00398FC9A2
MPTVHDIAAVLAPALDAERYAAEGDPTGVWLASDRPVRRLGLALEAGRPPYAWAEDVDAVLVHRPFGLWPARLPDGVGVLAAHRALDDRLTTGLNPALADALGLIPDDEPLRRDGAPIGLVCRTDAPLETVAARIEAAFGGIEDRAGEIPQTGAVALANAMTAELVEEAAARGVGLYLTGQIRKPGLAAVAAAGIGVRAVGQDRAEAWGLRYLRALVRQRWPAIEIVEVDLPPRQPGSM